MNPTSLKKSSGASLVEILVGLVIGMVVMLTIFEVVTTFEGQQRTTTQGMGAQENGLYAITALERDVRMAGWGLTSGISEKCATVSRFDQPIASRPGGITQSFRPVPVRIIDNGTDTRIVLVSGTSVTGSTPNKVLEIVTGTNVELDVKSVIGFAKKDVIVTSTATGTDCNLGEITNDINPSTRRIQRAASSGSDSNFNPSAFPDEQIGSAIYNLGKLIVRTYRIESNPELTASVLMADDLVANDTDASVEIADNIVAMKAQYGVEDTTGAQPILWVSASRAPWNNLSATEAQSIKAIRVFFVARSPLREKRNAENTCATTPLPPSPNWNDNSLQVDLSANREWQCYRYKTFETIIPVRNALWAGN